jgi:hypothetical protein
MFVVEMKNQAEKLTEIKFCFLIKTALTGICILGEKITVVNEFLEKGNFY